MKKIWGLSALALLLVGCATAPRLMWSKAGSNEQEFARDQYDCLKESQQRVARSSPEIFGPGQVSSNRIETNEVLLNSCLRARGYTLIAVDAAMQTQLPSRAVPTFAPAPQVTAESSQARERLKKFCEEMGDVCQKSEFK